MQVTGEGPSSGTKARAKKGQSRERVLWIHAGGAKSGSSALQNAFECIVDQLTRSGIAYENRIGINHSLQITRGNGILLYVALSRSTADSSALKGLLQSYFGGRRQAICSSEELGRLNVMQWQKLSTACSQLRIELHVVYYVRDVVEKFLAQYDQAIKHDREWRDFPDWIKGVPWSDAGALKSMAHVVPPHRLHILHFNSCRSRLLRSFLGILGVEAIASKGAMKADMRVNRSLTNLERNRLKEINKAYGYLSTDELADRLLYGNGGAVPEPVVAPKRVIRDLEKRVRSDVHWVNSQFFPGRRGVSFLAAYSGRTTTGSKRAQAQSDVANGVNAAATIERITAQWAFEQLAMIRLQTFRWIATVLRRIEKPRDPTPGVPVDFDPIAYLFSNLDLLAAGVEPYAHYRGSGHKEGRVWRWSGSDADGARALG